MLQAAAAASAPTSPDILSQVFLHDNSPNYSKGLVKEAEAAVRPSKRCQLSDYCSSEPHRDENVMGSNSFPITRDHVDSLCNTFLQFDLMRNVREQLHGAGEQPTSTSNAAARDLESEQLPDDLFRPLQNPKELRLKKPKDATESPEVRMNKSESCEMEEWEDYEDLQQQAISQELELKWYKHKYLQLRSRVKALLQEKFSMGRQIEKMSQILSSERSSTLNPPIANPSFVDSSLSSCNRSPNSSTSYILPGPISPYSTPNGLLKVDHGPQQKVAPNSLTYDRDLKILSKSQIDRAFEAEDIIYQQDMYYTASASASGWQDSWTPDHQQSYSNSGILCVPKSFHDQTVDANMGFQQPPSMANLQQASVLNPEISRTQSLQQLQHPLYVSDHSPDQESDIKLKNLVPSERTGMRSVHDPLLINTMGRNCQPVVSQGVHMEQRLSVAAHESSHLDLSKTEMINQPANFKNTVRNLSVRWKGKSVTSERSSRTAVPFYHDLCDISSSSSGSNQDSSPGSPSPIRPKRLYWEDAENLTTSSSPKDVCHQGQMKTELCKNWQEYGNCPYSIHCRFAHGVGELRPVLRHPLYKTQICRMLMEGKRCIYNHRCHFRHSLTDEEISLIARLRECST